MSDGPYKSLPMKPSWKRAAKCALKEAFSSDDIVESVTHASHADWRSEVRQSFVTSIAAIVNPSGQQALFQDQALADLDTLRCNSASPLEASFARNVADAVKTGRTGNDVVHLAAEAALSDRLLCNYRQVEEHVRRKDSDGNAEFVRSRLEAAHLIINLPALVQSALKTGHPLTRRSRTQFTSLDAGVSL